MLGSDSWNVSKYSPQDTPKTMILAKVVRIRKYIDLKDTGQNQKFQKDPIELLV
jgi:hypothetical protein